MKKALIIGLEEYPKHLGKLKGSSENAKEIGQLLTRNESISSNKGDLNFDCLVLNCNTNRKTIINRKEINKACKELFEDQESDALFLYFSGYAIENEMGQYLLTPDTTDFDFGIALNDILFYANSSPAKEINIVLNCTYKLRAKKDYALSSTLLRNGLSILTVKNYSSEKSIQFANTTINLLNGSNSNILGHVTFVELFEHAFDVLSDEDCEIHFQSNTSRISTLRKTLPKISYEVLKQIPSFFMHPSYYYPLTKQHIPALNLGTEDQVLEYKTLQKMARFGLVKPVNANHMYYAALNEKHCCLTEHGKQIWELLNMNRL